MNPKPLLNKENFLNMGIEKVAEYHGITFLLDFVMEFWDGQSASVSYEDYMKWYLDNFSPLGRAMQ